MIDQLRSRELDAVIGRLSEPDNMAGVTFEHLYAEPMVVALRPGHPLTARHAKGGPLLAELSNHPLVLPLPGTMIRQLADGFLVSHGIVPRAGLVETLDVALARALVLSGNHLWLTPLGAVTPDLESGAIARLDVTITPEEPVGLMLRADSMPSAALQALLGVVRHEAAARRGQFETPAPRRRLHNRK